MHQPDLFEQVLDALAGHAELSDEAESLLLNSDHYFELADYLLVTTVREAFAVHRGTGRGGRPPRPSQEAWEWIERDLSEGKEEPFSFYSCCKAAGVDPEELQEQLLFKRFQEPLVI